MSEKSDLWAEQNLDAMGSEPDRTKSAADLLRVADSRLKDLLISVAMPVTPAKKIAKLNLDQQLLAEYRAALNTAVEAARTQEQKYQESMGRCVRHKTLFTDEPCHQCVSESEQAAFRRGREQGQAEGREAAAMYLLDVGAYVTADPEMVRWYKSAAASIRQAWTPQQADPQEAADEVK